MPRSPKNKENQEQQETFEFVWEETRLILANYDDVTGHFLEREQKMCQVCLSHLVKLNITRETLWKSAYTDTFKKKFKDIRKLLIIELGENMGIEVYNWSLAVFSACVVKIFSDTAQLDSIAEENLVNNNTGDVILRCCDPKLFDPECLSEEENRYLDSYRGNMCIARSLFGPKASKGLMISVCGILEESGKRYVTGSESKEPTLRREFIYHQICGKWPKKRPPANRTSKRSVEESTTDGTSAPKKAKRVKKVDKKGPVPLQNNSSAEVSPHQAEWCSRQHGLQLEQVRDGDMSDDLHDLLDSAVDEFHSQISQSVVVSAAVCCSATSAGNDGDDRREDNQLNGSDSNDSDYSDTCGSSSGSDTGESREYDELDSEDILGDIFDFC